MRVDVPGRVCEECAAQMTANGGPSTADWRPPEGMDATDWWAHQNVNTGVTITTETVGTFDVTMTDAGTFKLDT